MVKEITEGQAKDAILEFLLEEPDQSFSPYKIKEAMFPDLNLEEVTLLVERILNGAENVVEGNLGQFDNTFVKANGITKRFLNQGGFSKIEIELKADNERALKKELLEITLAESNIEANKLNKKNEKSNRWGMYINILIGILNIGLLFYQIFLKA